MHSQSIKLEVIEDSLSAFRLTSPEQVNRMRQSLDSVGQLHPVIVRACPDPSGRKGSFYQLLDGFKRYYAFRALKKESMQAC